MAELVGVVSSAITFATFAVQVSKSVQTLKGYWDSIRDAPDDLKWLLREVEILGCIIADVDKDLSQGSVPLGLRDSQHVTQSLHLCEEAVECLESLCKDLLQGIGSSSRMRRSYQAARIILHERRTEKHISKLHSVVRLLMLSQQCYIRAVVQVQPSLIAEEIRNLGVASSHTLIAEHVSAPYYVSLALIETSAGASKLQKGQFRPHKGRFFWLLRAPHWMTSRVLEISGMKTLSGWDWSFRTYSEVRWASDFDCDLREGRIENIQHRFASGQLSPFSRTQGSGRSLLHYAVCVGRNNQMVDFLLEQGVDPSIEGGLSTSKTPLRLVLEIGRQAASNKLYPLLPYLRCLLHHSQHLVYNNAEEAVDGILSEFHGTSEEFRFLQQHCCPTFYQMPRWARIKVAAQIVCDANHSYYAEEANNTPDLIKTVLSKDTLEVKTFQAKFTLPFTPKETTLMHCIAEKLGTTQGFLQMSCRWKRVANCRYQRFTQPANTLCLTRWQAIYESWNSLFFDFLRVGGDIHQIVDGKTLLIAFLEGYLASLLSLSESNQALWLGQEICHAGIRAWLKDMRTAGLDLEGLGAHEWRIWKSGKVQREFNGGFHRVTGIFYGPYPEDWYIWLLEPSDSFVGEFWALVERSAETMPGEWPSE